MRHERRLLHNVVAIFHVENVSPGKTERKKTAPFNRFSSYFHQNNHTVWTSNGGNRCLWKSRSRSKFTKWLIFEAQICLINFQRQISLMVIGNHKISKEFEFGSKIANNDRHCFSKCCSIFNLFQTEWKTKKLLRMSEITFSKMFYRLW